MHNSPSNKRPLAASDTAPVDVSDATTAPVNGANMLAFGCNDAGQCAVEGGDDEYAISTPSPARPLSGGAIVTHVAFGASHAVWLSSEGAVYTMGENSHGECGMSLPSDVVRTPTRLESLAQSYTAVDLAVGAAHTVVITAGGAAFSFGQNDLGQCGLGAGAELDVRRPKLVKHQQHVLQASCGDQHTLLLDSSAQVLSCGSGRFGALGVSSATGSQPTPTPVSTLETCPVRQVAAAGRHSVALTYGGAVLAWGYVQRNPENSVY
jgi:alpha-tubulin suppressor-like RCC1 family protein